ncbi:sialidase family protein [Tenggerimyces flavus]|uniref:exo-alpha-sialidase n=1 Tax=Tenggerimyces flavus TaxID=1708749 RepID=A0ABV7Y8S3_9ACTN|nr:sialidase family protein [Tenggerimyces flavus]MBM7785592.1 sialidase-1 [Tenggerimyces flavus]
MAPKQLAPSPPTESLVFTNADRSYPYNVYHQVGIARAANGHLLAYAEGRIDTGDSTMRIDLVCRRSTDGGRTWNTAISRLYGYGTIHYDGADRPLRYFNGNLLVDNRTGHIFAFAERKIGDQAYSEANQFRANRLVYKKSTDHGVTWGAENEIPEAVFAGLPGDRHVTSPGHGIQTSTGRLIMPVSNQFLHYSPDYTVSFLYSDDSGTTWQMSEYVRTPLPYSGLGEVRVAETGIPNQLRALGRGRNGNSDPSHPGDYFKVTSLSEDNGRTWSPAALVTELPEWIDGVDGGMARFTNQAGGLLVASTSDVPPGWTGNRGNLNAYYSRDGGASWAKGPRFITGPSSNSDLVQVDGTTIGCVYEKGKYADRSVYQSPDVVFARFDEAWLTTPEPLRSLRPASVWKLDELSGTVARDSGSSARHGTVVGGTWVSAGRNGGALRLNGTSAYVDLHDVLDPGSGGYTVCLWFRRSSVATLTSPQVLASKGNRASQREGWSIMLTPPGNQLLVRVNAGTNEQRASRQMTTPLSDTNWHHVALVVDRQAGVLRGYLDGTDAYWNNGGSGPTDNLIDGFGGIDNTDPLYIGAVVDQSASHDFFAGTIDDVQIFTAALNTREIAAIASS